MGIEITIKIDDVEMERKDRLESTPNSAHKSAYARFFDESCPAWTKNSEYNLTYLKQQQVYANDLLKIRGYMFLNEVYDMLGMPRTKAGQVVGWIYDAENSTGDNYIEFDIYSECNKRFVNGHDRIALLDFNVDGIILDKIP